jgi:hypothetical protein
MSLYASPLNPPFWGTSEPGWFQSPPEWGIEGAVQRFILIYKHTLILMRYRLTIVSYQQILML